MMPDMAVEVIDSGLGLSRIRHEDEASSAGEVIKRCEDDGVLYQAKLTEERFELIRGRIERKVEDVQIALCAIATTPHHNCGQRDRV